MKYISYKWLLYVYICKEWTSFHPNYIIRCCQHSTNKPLDTISIYLSITYEVANNVRHGVDRMAVCIFKARISKVH